MLARLSELKKDGLKPINVYNCWLGRCLPPLKKRSHLMCDYTGEDDTTRTSHEEWEEKDYAAAVALITKALFSSLDEPLQPFDKVGRLLPEVNTSSFAFIFMCLILGLECLLTASRLLLRNNHSGIRSPPPPTRRGGTRRAEGGERA